MAKEEEKKVEEIVPVGPGMDSEERMVSEDEEHDAPDETGTDPETDERAGHAESDTEEGGDRTAIRERRREEKRRKREQRNRDITELRFLRQRNDSLERRQTQIENRQSQNETLAIDTRINEYDQKIREAEAIHAEAVKKGAGDEATEALRIRDQFRDGVAQLRTAKENQTREAQAQRRPASPDPAIMAKAQNWMQENDWFDPRLGNEDSVIAKAIEDHLYREGRLDARQGEYWEEYNRRLAKRLPHLFKKGKNVRTDDDEDEDEDSEESRQEDARRSTPRGPRITTGGRERPLKKNEVYVNSERKAAMVEAGVWDDPVLRARYLKKYQDYDREHGAARRH